MELNIDNKSDLMETFRCLLIDDALDTCRLQGDWFLLHYKVTTQKASF